MARITLSLNGTVLREMELAKDRVTIGRGPGNDLLLDNLAVSAEHAAIVTLENDSFLEDLNSTNGTQVNGQPIRKHFLQDEDVIEIAQYRIKYQSCSMNRKPSYGTSVAKVAILDGFGIGKEILLINALTTIGRPGIQVAAVARRAQGYFLIHLEGNMAPSVNGNIIGDDACELIHGDVIYIAGTRMKFSSH